MPLLTCPDCYGNVSDTAPACIHCGRPMAAAASGRTANRVGDGPRLYVEVWRGGETLRGLGWVAVIGGGMWFLFALLMDTSVPSGAGSVHNLSLANARLVHLVAGATIGIAGLIMVGIGYSARRLVREPREAMVTAPPPLTRKGLARILLWAILIYAGGAALALVYHLIAGIRP
jgi:hypothetical protein